MGAVWRDCKSVNLFSYMLALLTTAADTIFQRKLGLTFFCELSAYQTMHMKCRISISLKLYKKSHLSQFGIDL